MLKRKMASALALTALVGSLTMAPAFAAEATSTIQPLEKDPAISTAGTVTFEAGEANGYTTVDLLIPTAMGETFSLTGHEAAGSENFRFTSKFMDALDTVTGNP